MEVYSSSLRWSERFANDEFLHDALVVVAGYWSHKVTDVCALHRPLVSVVGHWHYPMVNIVGISSTHMQ